MKRISKSMIGFFLILVLMLSLCACAQKQLTGTEIDEPNISTDRETLPLVVAGYRERKIQPMFRTAI